MTWLHKATLFMSLWLLVFVLFYHKAQAWWRYRKFEKEMLSNMDAMTKALEAMLVDLNRDIDMVTQAYFILVW